MNFTIKTFHGKEISKWLELIAELRMAVFKEFPYLYSGSVDIEKKYLASFAADDHSIFTLAFCNDEMAGILTGIPLSTDLGVMSENVEIFAKQGLHAQDYYYYGEFIVIPKYRNQGVARKFSTEQTKYVKRLGYKNLCLTTIDREANHPLKPSDYINTDIIWEKFGFIKTTMKVCVEWPTFMADGSVKDTDNFMTFWVTEKI